MCDQRIGFVYVSSGVKSEGKVVPVKAMKTCEGSGCLAPFIFNLPSNKVSGNHQNLRNTILKRQIRIQEHENRDASVCEHVRDEARTRERSDILR